MVKVESQGTLWLLTMRFLKINQKRNKIAILAIILTTTLFTSLFTGTVSMGRSKLEADKKTYGSWAHVILQDITQEDARKVSDVLEKSSDVKRFGVNMFVGTLHDERILFQTEVRAVDMNAAESLCNAPIQGRLPQRKDEIALSSLVLDMLGIVCPSDENIPDQKIILTIALDSADVEEEHITQEFYLCGWWEGDVSDYSQYAWVSEEFAKESVPAITRTDLENGAMSGAVGFSVWYKNLWNLQKKTSSLNKTCGLLQTGGHSRGFQVNPAYEALTDEEGISLSGMFALVILIVIAGYLIIYNIFSISVKTDIRAYGLLKNIGTTGKQLARIVRKQAFCLCLMGIPIGVLAGYGCGVLLSPALAADLDNISHLQETSISANPMIFVVSAVFALVTVYCSCIQACRIVAQVSPIEALRIAEGGQRSPQVNSVRSTSNHSQQRLLREEVLSLTQENVQKMGILRTDLKRRFTYPDLSARFRMGVRVSRIDKSAKASWWGMALGNFAQNWKRGMIVMLSISISLMIVNGIFMMVRGYSLDQYQETYMASDFELDKLPDYAPYAVMNGVTEEIQELIDTCPNAECIGYVRYSEEYHEMEPHLYAVWDKIAQERLSGVWRQRWEQMKAENKIKITLMGIDRAVFDKLQWCGEAHTWESFAQGNYVIVDNPLLAGQDVSNYQAGDDFVMVYQSGVSRQYQVLDEARLPYSLDYPYANLIAVTVMIPDEEFITCTGSTAAMRALIDAVPGSEEKVQQYLEETVLQRDKALLLHSVLDLRKSFARFLNKYYYVGGALAVVLALIGIMNFYNMMAASMLSRKRELALLEVVGMTQKQIRRMLAAEGGLYLGGAFLIAVGMTVMFGRQLLTAALGQAFFFHLNVTVLPSVILLPLLAVIAFFLPAYQFWRMGRESVVERISEHL